MMILIGRINELKALSDAFLVQAVKPVFVANDEASVIADISANHASLLTLWFQALAWLLEQGYERYGGREAVVAIIPYVIWYEDDEGDYRIVGLDNEALYKENQAYRTQKNDEWAKELAYMPAVIGKAPYFYEAVGKDNHEYDAAAYLLYEHEEVKDESQDDD